MNGGCSHGTWCRCVEVVPVASAMNQPQTCHEVSQLLPGSCNSSSNHQVRVNNVMSIFKLCGVRIINIYINYYIMLLVSLSVPLLLFHDHISSFGALCCGAAISLAVPAGHWPNITNESGEKFWHFTNTCWLGKVGPPELRLLCAQVETWS